MYLEPSAVSFISTTITCAFAGMQDLHVKKHPEVLPFISLGMLSALNLGHMIRLVASFQDLFLQINSNQEHDLYSVGRWPEIITAITSMLAFLIQSRLLMLTWSARLDFGEHRTLWFYDKTTLLLSLPFYGAGMLMVLLNDSSNVNLKSCADVLIDGFLLPQFFLNLLRSSKEAALCRSFYMGTTFLQLIRHVCNFYRFHSPSKHSDGDHYFVIWDMVVFLWSPYFVQLIYIQQKHGGDYIFIGKSGKFEVVDEKGIAARDQ